MASKTEVTVTLPVTTAFILLGFLYRVVELVPMQSAVFAAIEDARNRLREASEALDVE